MLQLASSLALPFVRLLGARVSLTALLTLVESVPRGSALPSCMRAVPQPERAFGTVSEAPRDRVCVFDEPGTTEAARFMARVRTPVGCAAEVAGAACAFFEVALVVDILADVPLLACGFVAGCGDGDCEFFWHCFPVAV